MPPAASHSLNAARKCGRTISDRWRNSHLSAAARSSEAAAAAAAQTHAPASSPTEGKAAEMSRSGYDDCDCGDYRLANLYRANVDRAFAGKRGQAFLKEMLAAMDALPDKKLIFGVMQEDSGEVCAIGSVGKARGIDMERLNRLAEEDDPQLAFAISRKFGITRHMAAEIMFMNDGYRHAWEETPEARFTRMRKWIESQIHS